MTEPYTAAERARQTLIDDAARVSEAGLRKKRLEDAAPDLYEAAVGAKVALEETANILRANLPSLADNVIGWHVRQLEAAIAKAEGRS